MSNKKILIIGSGLTGALLACVLAKRGFDIEIYEKRDDLVKTEESRKVYRTIGMSISIRGLSALKQAGLENVIQNATQTYGRVTHDYEGSEITQYYSNEGSAILTIDRMTLNQNIINNLNNYNNVQIFFNSALKDINFDTKTCAIEYGSVLYNKTYDYLIGADGVFSTCRTLYEAFLSIPQQIKQLAIGYKEFRIPFKYTKDALDERFVNVWPSKDQNAIFVALPSQEKECFLVNIFCPIEWVAFFQEAASKQKIIDYLLMHFPSLNKLLPKMDEEYFIGNAANMYQVRSNNWHYKDSFLLIGDAAHAISPFYAMGMNLCFESCMIFDKLIEDSDHNISKAIKIFQRIRKKDTDAMQDLAYENFFSISFSTSKYYDNIWNVERRLFELSQGKWKPEYHLIAFTNDPLSKVKTQISRQREWLKELIDERTGNLKTLYNNQQDIDSFLESHNKHC